MSLAEKSSKLRRGLLAGVILTCLALGGCFRPLYGTGANQMLLANDLAGIDVAPIDGLTGHYLREELLFSLTNGATVPARYRLKIEISERTLAAAVDSSGGRADAAAVQVIASYVLSDLANKELTSGTAIASGSIDRLSQRFAAVRAVRDAEIRIAKVIAEDITTRLAAFLTKG